MDDSYRYGAPSGQNPRGSTSTSALDSSRSSPSLPLYVSGPSTGGGGGGGASAASMVPGLYQQGGYAGGAQQRHSFHIPPSHAVGLGLGDGRGGMGAPAQNTGLGHVGPQRATATGVGADSGMSPARRSFGGETSASSSASGPGLLPFARGGSNLPSLHTTQSHDPAMHSGMNVDVSDRERAAASRDAEWGAGASWRRTRAADPLAAASGGFLGRSASLGGRGKKDPYALPRDDVEGGMRGRNDDDDEGEEVDDDDQAWAGDPDPYAVDNGVRARRQQPRSSHDGFGGSGGGGQQAYPAGGYGASTHGSIPLPLNLHLMAPGGAGSMSAPASADASLGGAAGSPMSTSMSPMMHAAAMGGTNGSSSAASNSADPWPQYRQAASSSSHAMAQHQQRYAQAPSGNVIDLSPSDRGDDPFGQHRHGRPPVPASASAMSVDTRYTSTPMDTTPNPQSVGLNMPYLPADSTQSVSGGAYAPQRQQTSRSRSQQQVPYTPQQGQAGRAQADQARQVENGHPAKRDRAARAGFRRVSSTDPEKDLQPRPVDPAASGRRADPNVPGAFLSVSSPLRPCRFELTIPRCSH